MQALQKGPFSISELVIFLFNALASFQLTLTGNNKSYCRYDMYLCTGICLIKATLVALACRSAIRILLREGLENRKVWRHFDDVFSVAYSLWRH